MALGESRENYLKSILILTKAKGSVRAVDLSHFMGLSKASVSIAVGRLRGEGYVAVGEEGALGLTEAGRAEAEAVYERYCFFAQKLTDLGVPVEQAHLDACRLEHAISEESFAAIRRASEYAFGG